MNSQDMLHPCSGLFRVGQKPCFVGEFENLRQVSDGTGALLPADHDEMVLMAVQICHEHDAGFIKTSRRPEYMAGQRHRRFEDAVKFL